MQAQISESGTVTDVKPLTGNAVLAGTTNLSLQFTASDAAHPVQQVDLFLDGIKYQTLTNLPPRVGNVLQISINGFTTNYPVPVNATIKSVASNVVSVLNNASNITLAMAVAHGDRVELQSLKTNVPGAQIPVSVSNSIGSADSLTTFLTASRTNFLDSIAGGVRSFTVAGVPGAGDFLQIIVTKTNGTTVTLAVTNSAPGPTSVQFAQQLFNLINNTVSLQGAATKAILEAEAKAVEAAAGVEVEYVFGTMIEVPRGALTADEIAHHAAFFSFGTNDLTQMTFGYSRDDAEGGFLLKYVEDGILPVNPFQTLDDAVAGLMKMAVDKGRATRPDLELGICGEHGGDPESIAKCERIGLDYVSCSPFRVPVARLAAAQAVLTGPERDK